MSCDVVRYTGCTTVSSIQYTDGPHNASRLRRAGLCSINELGLMHYRDLNAVHMTICCAHDNNVKCCAHDNNVKVAMTI